MNEENLKYREIHGVLKELDFVNFNNPFDNIKETEVQHSKYASPEGTRKTGAGSVAKGILKTSFGLLGAVSGGGWYSADKAGEGIGEIIGGVGNHQVTNDVIAKVITDISTAETQAWKYLEYTRNFVPADGNIGDVVFKDGSCDDFHCGNGHVFYDNGDYFEGYFEDGTMKKGLYIWSNGQRYLGEFDENNNTTGLGLIIYPNGTYYYGNFSNGLKHGDGLQIYTDGAFSGLWLNEQRDHGSLRLDDGSCFYGEFEDGQPVG